MICHELSDYSSKLLCASSSEIIFLMSVSISHCWHSFAKSCLQWAAFSHSSVSLIYYTFLGGIAVPFSYWEISVAVISFCMYWWFDYVWWEISFVADCTIVAWSYAAISALSFSIYERSCMFSMDIFNFI